MHVFCHESGGADPANDVFLVAAVIISGANATRMLKSFCKAVSWTEVEVKGHALRPEPRRIFFDLVAREADVRAVVVHCQRREVLGGWAMNAMPEIALYRCLLCEACEKTAGSGSGSLTITVDGGRYKRAELRDIEVDLTRLAGTWTMGQHRATVNFRDSASIPGLQIADVIVNTAFQCLGHTPTATYAETLLSPLRHLGCLTLCPVELEDCRPAWVTQV